MRRRRWGAAALLAFVAFSGLQCVQDLITTPPPVNYVFTVTPGETNDSALVYVGDTIRPITAALTADGQPAGFTLGCTVTSGTGVVQVDTAAGCRLIITGRGVAQVRVRPQSVSLPVDTIERTVKVVAFVPRIGLPAVPTEDTLYSLLETKTLQATAQTRGHVAIPGVPITWRLVSGANFVTLLDAAAGTVRADSNGVAVLEATVDTAHAQRTVRVRQRATTMALTVPQVRLRAVGQTWSVGATLRDARTNSVYDRSPTTWIPRNPNVARVTAGLITAAGEGATYVVASFSEPALGGPALAESTAVIVQLAHLRFVAGSPQTDTVGAPVAVELEVQLVDGSGAAVPEGGIPVVFKAGSGGGKFGTPAGLADSVIVTTRELGQASARPTLGNTVGTETFTAYGPGLTGSAVAFSLTGVADAPSAIVVDSGAAQTDTVARTLSKALVVQVRDRFANPVPGAVVRFVVTAGGGKVGAGQDSVVVTADANGRARTTHTLGSTAGAHTVTVRAAFGTPVTFTATAVPARAKRLRFTQQPANLVAGGSFATAPVVQVQDSLGNIVPSATPSIGLALATNSAGVTLGGTATVTATAGVATFSALTISKVGTALRIVATATGLVSDTSAAFNVVAGAAQRIAFLVQPVASRSGRPIAPAVQIGVLDALGNTVTGAQLDVTLSIGTIPSGGSSSVFGSPTVATVAGVATFTDLGVQNVASGYRLRATAPGLAAITSDLFDVRGAPASFVLVSGNDRTGTPGAALDSAFVVAVKDAAGNGVPSDTVIFKVTAGGGAFGSTDSAIAVTGPDGRASARLTLGAAVGTNTVTARSTSLPGTTLTFNATAISGVLHLAFGTQPSRVTLGSAISPVVRVEVRDALGALVTSASPTATLAVTSGTGRAGAALTGAVSVTAVNGVATFTGVGVNRAGTGYSLTATAGSITAVTSTTFDVVGVPASIQVYSGNNQNGTPGSTVSLPLVAQVFDANGDPVAGDTVVFKITTPASGGSVGGGLAAHDSVLTYTDGQGRGSVQLTLPTSTGSVTVQAWSTRLPGTSVQFTASATAAGRLLEFVTQPTSATAATAIAPAVQVRVRDAAGATDATATTIITLAITSGTGTSGATLGGTLAVAAVNGVATFSNLAVNLVGTAYTLTATAGGLTSATSSAFNVAAGAAHHLEITSPSGATAGTAMSPDIVVRVVDAGGNLVAGATTSVNLTLTGGTGTAGAHLRGTLSVNAVGGVARFTNASIDSAGTGYTLTAAGGGLLSATTGAFAVSAAPAVRIAFAARPLDGTAGVPLTPIVVLVQDSLGNTATGSSAVVTLSIDAGPVGAALLGDASASAVNGVATFSGLRLLKHGAEAAGTGYVLLATSSGFASVRSHTFDVVTGPIDRLVFTVQPANATPGATLSAVQVVVQDSVGNVIPTFTAAVTLAITSGTGTADATLGGTASVSAVNGMANFSTLSVALAGNNYTLTATAPGVPTNGVSAVFSVLSAAASRLVFTAAPTSIVPGERFTVTVTVKDGSGNTVTSATDAITLAITSGWGNPGAALRGTRTVNAVAGVATFSGLSIDSAGVYQLTASAASLASGTSGNVVNNAGPPTRMVFGVQPSSRTAGSVFAPAISIQLRDSLNNFTSFGDVAITIGLNPASNPGGATLAGTTTVSSNGGIATFADLSVNKVGTGYELVASTGTVGVSGATSASFSIAAGVAASIVVTPLGASLSGLGASRTFTVEVRDAWNNIIANPTLMWTSLNPGVASVNASTGTVAVVEAGQATIAATSGTATGYALVTAAIPNATPVNLWAPMTGGGSEALFAVWGASDTSVFAGGYGRILRGSASGWSVSTTACAWGIWGTSSTDVFAGYGDRICHFDGANWSVTSIGSGSVGAIWGTSPRDVYVLAGSGLILHYDGSTWSPMNSGTSANLHRIWGTSPTDIWAVGNAATILHFDGSSWSSVAAPAGVGDLYGMHGISPTEVYAVGNAGLIKYDGSRWSAFPGSGYFDVWGSSGSDLYTVGGADIPHFDGTNWSLLRTGLTGAFLFRDVWGTALSHVYVVGENGTALRGYRGATVAVTPASPTLQTVGRTKLLTATVRTAAGTEVTGVTVTWSSGNTGVATVDASTGVVTAVANGTATITATAPGGASGSTVVTVSQVAKTIAVTPGGASLSGVGATTTLGVTAQDSLGNAIASPPAVTWTSLNPNVATVNASSGVVTAVASGQVTIAATSNGVTGYGVLTVAIPGATPVNLWAPMASGTTQDLHGVWGTSGSDVYAVGSAGTVLRFNGTSWTAMSSGTTQGFERIWGTSGTDIYAVGISGTILRYSGSSWSAMTSGTTQGGLFDVWGSSPSNVYAVGTGGTILRYDGTSWTAVTSGTALWLQGVWGTSSSDVYAVGDAGSVLHYNGSSWSAQASVTTRWLQAVWGTSGSDLFAVSQNTFLHYDGTTWLNLVSGPTTLLNDVWGSSGSDVYAVGTSGAILRYDGASLSTMTSGTTQGLHAVWGTSSSDVFALGEGGTILRGVRGATVAVTPATPTLSALSATAQLTATALSGSTPITGVTGWTWSSATPAVATVDAATGLVTAVAPGTAAITATATGGASGLTVVTVSQAAKAVAVSPGGASLSTVGATQTFTVMAQDSLGNAIASPPAVTWTSLNPNVATVNASSGVVTAVASGQVTISATSGTATGYALLTVAISGATPVNLWASMASGDTVQWLGVWGTSATNAFAVGGSGTIQRWDGTSWAAMTSGTTNYLYGVWGTSPTDVYAVGSVGTIRRWNGTAWSAMTSGTTNDLYGVWGTSPTDVFAVGVNGTALHYNGSAWSATVTGTSSLLTHVWGASKTAVFAVGYGGTIVRYDGNVWTPMASGLSQRIHGVWGTSATNVYAAAYDEARLLHYDGTSWSAVVNVGKMFWGVWGTSGSDIYLVGACTVCPIVRYDGATAVSMSGTGLTFLNGVWGTATGDVYVVGEHGTILRGVRGASVEVTPATPTLTAIGATQRLTATALSGSTPITGVTGWTWSSATPGVATVNADGFVTAVANGTANIIATAPGGASGYTVVTVGQVAKTLTMNQVGYYLYVTGGTFTPTIEVRDSLNHLVPNPAVSWTSFNPNVATVNATTGEVTAVAPGEATVAATSGSATGYLLVAVSQSGLQAINAWAQVPTGTTENLRALWGSSPTNLYASGGNIFRYTGSSWTSQVTGSGLNYRAVWGVAPTDVWAVGPSGSILHCCAPGWTAQASGVSAQFYGVWGRSPRDIYAVGDGGTILHYDGSTWTPQVSGVTETLRAVWGVQGEAWAVGGAGTILHQASGTTTWTPQPSGTGQPLYAIRGFDVVHIRITGEAGTILSYNGSAWLAQDSRGTESLTGVAGSGESDLYAVSWGDPPGAVNGRILTWNGSAWSSIEAPLTGLTGVFALGSDIWVSALNGGLLRGYRGATVTVTPATPTLTALGATQQLTAAAKDAANHDISGVTGYSWSSATPAVATVNATTGVVTAVANGTATITATAPGGASGSTTVTVAQVTASVVVTPGGASVATPGGSQPFTAQALDANANPIPGKTFTWSGRNTAVATISGSGTVTALSPGQTGVAATVDGFTGYALLTVTTASDTALVWSPVSTGQTSQINALWGTSASNVYAVGSFGSRVLRRFDGSTWSAVSVPGGNDLHDVWGTASNDIWAVGVGGAVLRYNGSAWSSVTSPSTSTGLHAVWGSAQNDVYTGGDFGNLYHWNGTAWSYSSTGLGNSDFVQGIWGTSAADVYAVADNGKIAHYDGSTWSLASPTGQDLRAVWGTASNSVFAVGAAGTILQWNGSSWTSMNSGTSKELKSIWGSAADDIYTVGGDGTGGVLLHYNGSTWSTLTSPTIFSLYAVWGTSPSNVFIGDFGGKVSRGQHIQSVEVTPASPTLTAVGATQQMTATAKDAANNPIAGVTGWTWSSGSLSVATVNPTTGVVTAVANGTADIVAEAVGGVTGTATIAVNVSAATLRIVAGKDFSCSLALDGTARCWGENSGRQLGDGTSTDRTSPVAVAGGITFQALSAGSDHSCGLTTSGAAYCWGFNSFGDLGNGTSGGYSASPAAVVGGLTFQAISAGSEHTCGITTSGAAYCWGRNDFGQLGTGTTGTSYVPVAVAGGLTFQALSAGRLYACGLTTGGAAYCWGWNSYGQLGDSTTTSNRTSPVAVAGGLTFQALSTFAGSDQTCALTPGGAAYCWGSNSKGQLGDSTTSNRSSPVAVVGGLTFQALSIGGSYLGGSTCGLTTGGAAYCWGYNSAGQLGDESTSDRRSPVVVAGSLSFKALSAGGSHACGVTLAGAAYCWGSNLAGQLGDGTTGTGSTSPVLVVGGVVFGTPPVVSVPATLNARRGVR